MTEHFSIVTLRDHARMFDDSIDGVLGQLVMCKGGMMGAVLVLLLHLPAGAGSGDRTYTWSERRLYAPTGKSRY